MTDKLRTPRAVIIDTREVPEGEKLSELEPVPLPGGAQPRIANEDALLYIVDLGPPKTSYQITVRDLKNSFGGVTGLTGDVTAGPGGGVVAATLAPSGVTAGTYGDATTVPRVTLDAKGRVTSVTGAPLAPGPTGPAGPQGPPGAPGPPGVGSWAGTVAGQLPFPATPVPSVDPNVLDEYEEGAFTPSVTLGGASVGLTYAKREGYYVKIGQLIWVTVWITLTAKGTSVGAVQITGLPFPGHVSTWGRVASPWNANLAGLTSAVMGYIYFGGSSAVALTMQGATGMAALTDAQLTNTTDLILVGTYRANV